MVFQLISEYRKYFPAEFYCWVFILGAEFGSFLNVLIFRMGHIYNKRENHIALSELKFATLLGRSYCPTCGQLIPFYHNIPILSWFFLKGKSACCHTTISFWYPLIEFGTAVAACIALMVQNVAFGLILFVLSYFIAASIGVTRKYRHDCLEFSAVAMIIVAWIYGSSIGLGFGSLILVGSVLRKPLSGSAAMLSTCFMWWACICLTLYHQLDKMQFNSSVFFLSGCLSVLIVNKLFGVTFTSAKSIWLYNISFSGYLTVIVYSIALGI